MKILKKKITILRIKLFFEWVEIKMTVERVSERIQYNDQREENTGKQVNRAAGTTVKTSKGLKYV